MTNRKSHIGFIYTSLFRLPAAQANKKKINSQ